jgi:hypothetical protein
MNDNNPPAPDSALTYPERAGKMAKRARAAAIKTFNKIWQRAKKRAVKITDEEIGTVNDLRECGLALQQMAGTRTQMLFDMAGKEFIRREILPHLPPGIGLEQVQACVHIAKTIPAPISTREELNLARQEMQLAFVALGLIEAPRRKELQNAHARNLFSDIVSAASGFTVKFRELLQTEPIESWPREKKEEYLETTNPIVETHEQVKRSLLTT